MFVRGLPVFLHQGDGSTVAAALLRENKSRASLVFIDGDHSRESVLRDARTILNAAPAANLLFHDTFYQPASWYNHGPYEAVQEVIASLEKPPQVVEVALGRPGMTLVLPSVSSGITR